MRSMLAKTFLVAVALTTLTVATSVVLTTRPLSLSEANSVSTDHGFSGSGSEPNPSAGLRVLTMLVKDPGFGMSVLAPQFLVIFPFMWVAALLGSRLRPVPAQA